MSMPGGMEWILILAVVVLLFGGKKIPELMRGVGKGIREFNDAKNNLKTEMEAGMKESVQEGAKQGAKEAVKEELAK